MLSSMAQQLLSSIKGDTANDFFTLGIDIGTTSIKTVIVHSVSSSPPQLAPSSQTARPRTPPTFSHSILSFHSGEHDATFPPSSSAPSHSEQDATKLLLSVQSCVRALPLEHRRKVEYVGVSCQMHGVVLWNDRQAVPYAMALFATSGSSPAFSLPPPHSRFIDWRDGRCSPAFLATLNASLPSAPHTSPLQSGQILCTGYATATLAHIVQHEPAFLTPYNRAGTIGDYVVWLLTNVRDEETGSRNIIYPSYIHPSNAAAWGCYQQDKHAWQTDRTTAFRIPSALLPTILTSSPLFPLTPVMCQLLAVSPTAHTAVSVGDAQASVWAAQPAKDQMVFYVGTSAQISIVMEDEKDSEDDEQLDDADDEGQPREPSVSLALSVNARAEGEEKPATLDGTVDFVLPGPPASASSSSVPPELPSCEYRPYLDGRQLLVCASLNGGNTFDWLARSLQMLHSQLASPFPLSPTSLSQSLPSAQRSSSIPTASSSSLQSAAHPVHPVSYYYELMLQQGYQYIPLPPAVTFHPTFFSERHVPVSSSSLASLSFLSPAVGALTPGSLSSALCLGVVRNVKAMLDRSAGVRGRRRMRDVREVLAVGGALRRNGLLRVYAEREWGRQVVMAKGMLCQWKRAELDRERKTRRVSGDGRHPSYVAADSADGEEEGSDDPSVYHPDAALGVAVFGLDRLWTKRAKELRAAKAMRLL